MENWCNSRGEWRTGATQGVNGELVQLKG